MYPDYKTPDINTGLTEDELRKLNYLRAKDEIYDLTREEGEEIDALFKKRNEALEG